MIDLEILCPVYGHPDRAISLIESFKMQEDINIKNIIISLTESNEEDDAKMIDYFNKEGITFFKVKKEEFSHSLTREKMIREYAKERILIMISHDIILNDERSIFNLAKPIAEREAVYAYGKQIVKKNCIEKYIREKNYPAESRIIEIHDSSSISIDDLFSSDSFACYDREVFIKIGGYLDRDLMMNEDQLYSYNLLSKGYRKKYVADAVCEHHHKYRLKDLYNRYYLAGKFYKENEEFKNVKITSSGLKLAIHVLGQSLIHFDFISLFSLIPNMMARYLGMRKGKRNIFSNTF